MSTKVICEYEDLVAIADSVRSKTGSSDQMTIGEIVSAVEGIESGSDVENATVNIINTDGSLLYIAYVDSDGTSKILLDYTNGLAETSYSINVNKNTMIVCGVSFGNYIASNCNCIFQYIELSSCGFVFKITGDNAIIDFSSADSSVEQTKDAGLYNADGIMLASWDELVNNYGMNASKTYTAFNYKTVTSSPYYVMSNNPALVNGVELVISDSLTSIWSYNFAYLSWLTKIIIPDSIKSLSQSALQGCTGLTSLTIPSSVTTIGNSAFRGCTGLTSITIPSSVTKIDGHAFRNCDGLISVYFEHTTAPIFKDECFYKSNGRQCTFYFKNNTVANAFVADTHYNSAYGAKSTNYSW